MKIEPVFDFDEVGVSEWDDRKPKKVVVPFDMAGEVIHHEVKRNLKHISVIACVSASGQFLTSYRLIDKYMRQPPLLGSEVRLSG
jgi:hypothetical protein